MNIKPLKILLIEDEIAYADWIEAILDNDNFPIVEFKHVKRIQEALISLLEQNFDAILLDLSLPDSQGMTSIFEVKKITSNIPIIVLTSLNDRKLALKALRNGVQDYLIKVNLTGELLIRSISYAMERHRAEVVVRQQALMKKMLDRIRQSLDLTEILDSTVAEVRQFLNVDKVLVYRYKSRDLGEIVTASSKISLIKFERNGKIDNYINDTNFRELDSVISHSDTTYSIEDAFKISPRETRILTKYRIRSLLTLTIASNSVIRDSIDTSNLLSNRIESHFLPSDSQDRESCLETKAQELINFNGKITKTEISHLSSDRSSQNPLWGILVAYNNNTPRKWRDWEIDFLKQLTTQVTIAIQQSELCHKLQDINRKLEQLAILDGLTGVANRRYFDRVLQNEWQRLAREQKPISLILCDIDYFKLYNDTYGHPTGDCCLQTVAKVLKTTVKRPADLVARYGGEEFAVILPDTDAEGAYCVASNIRHNLTRLEIEHCKSEVSSYVTLSIGVATQNPSYNLSPSQLIDEADDLLYHAKRQGRNRIKIKDVERSPHMIRG